MKTGSAIPALWSLGVIMVLVTGGALAGCAGAPPKKATDSSVETDGGRDLLPIEKRVLDVQAPCLTEAGEPCAPSPSCGNGLQDQGEECDDGDKQSGDGCSERCRLETDFACPEWGKDCVSTVVCNDGRISGKELCDDRNNRDGDGCSADCNTIEDGWQCPVAGVRCQPLCGDGYIKGGEQCDDANPDNGDGCSAGCKVEPGWACPASGGKCHKTVCGDKNPEGGESCDDGNLMPGDGCSPDCQSEPLCTGTSGCTSPCGDGLKLPAEDCDDGNKISGDGCSADCLLEANWDCRQEVEGASSDLTVPVIYRDMLPQTATSTNPPPHPNFEIASNGVLTLNVVLPTLGADRKPVYNTTTTAPATADSKTTNATDFNAWYHDSVYSKVVVDSIVLQRQPDGTFIYDHSSYWSTTLNRWLREAFFPLDNRGWAVAGGPEVAFLGTCDLDKAKHNFSFTSELRYWFEYRGNETLSFIGDDDVWVFVNGSLAVDLGGIHEATAGSVTLNAAAATRYGMTVGKVYEIVLFQAERKQSRSSYKLTLGQFNRTRTVCAPKCGDGVINGTELCDDGPANSDTAYGGCRTSCTLGPFCGDANTDSDFGEECDDGVNLSPYGVATGCAPGCRQVPFCGDGRVDSLYGESCDDGANNGVLGSWCDAACQAIIP